MLSNGYYLSIYISISDIAYVMNEFIRHDQNMALWYYDGDKITLCHYWEFERYTGLKHQFRAFYSLKQVKEIVNQLLKEYDLSLEDMQAIWGTPELEQYSKIPTEIRQEKQFSLHSYSHLFSSILSNSEYFYKETILALEVDGGPDGAYGKGMYEKYLYIGAIIERGEIKEYFPIESPGLLWNKLKKLTGLEEGTLMALGSASTSDLTSFHVEDIRITNYNQAKRGYKYITNLYNEIMGMPKEYINNIDPNFTECENKISIIVKKVTEISIRMMQRNINQAIERHHISPETTCLALSGGFALNCPINTMIMKLFKKILLAPPCINDSGISLGLGLFEFYNHLEYVKFDLQNAYYGKEITKEEISQFIESDKWSRYILKVTQIDYNEAVNDIIEAPVVWVSGRAEIGPRALGDRSLIGDPRNIKMKDRLNQIKQRQWWRPVAPIILEEQVQEWFEEAYPTKYMLNTFYIKKEKECQVPAIVHLDHSARVQTLEHKDNEELYQLIKQFYKVTDIPIICNTSLNDIGQPIINDIENTILFALKKGIKVVYINGNRFELNTIAQSSDDFELIYPVNFNIDDEQLVATKEKYERMKDNLLKQEIITFIRNPEIFMNYDIQKASDVKVIKRMQNYLSWDKQEI